MKTHTRNKNTKPKVKFNEQPNPTESTQRIAPPRRLEQLDLESMHSLRATAHQTKNNSHRRLQAKSTNILSVNIRVKTNTHHNNVNQTTKEATFPSAEQKTTALLPPINTQQHTVTTSSTYSAPNSLNTPDTPPKKTTITTIHSLTARNLTPLISSIQKIKTHAVGDSIELDLSKKDCTTSAVRYVTEIANALKDNLYPPTETLALSIDEKNEIDRLENKVAVLEKALQRSMVTASESEEQTKKEPTPKNATWLTIQKYKQQIRAIRHPAMSNLVTIKNITIVGLIEISHLARIVNALQKGEQERKASKLAPSLENIAITAFIVASQSVDVCHLQLPQVIAQLLSSPFNLHTLIIEPPRITHVPASQRLTVLDDIGCSILTKALANRASAKSQEKNTALKSLILKFPKTDYCHLAYSELLSKIKKYTEHELPNAKFGTQECYLHHCGLADTAKKTIIQAKYKKLEEKDTDNKPPATTTSNSSTQMNSLFDKKHSTKLPPTTPSAAGLKYQPTQ